MKIAERLRTSEVNPTIYFASLFKNSHIIILKILCATKLMVNKTKNSYDLDHTLAIIPAVQH